MFGKSFIKLVFGPEDILVLRAKSIVSIGLHTRSNCQDSTCQDYMTFKFHLKTRDQPIIATLSYLDASKYKNNIFASLKNVGFDLNEFVPVRVSTHTPPVAFLMNSTKVGDCSDCECPPKCQTEGCPTDCVADCKCPTTNCNDCPTDCSKDCNGCPTKCACENCQCESGCKDKGCQESCQCDCVKKE